MLETSEHVVAGFDADARHDFASGRGVLRQVIVVGSLVLVVGVSARIGTTVADADRRPRADAVEGHEDGKCDGHEAGKNEGREEWAP